MLQKEISNLRQKLRELDGQRIALLKAIEILEAAERMSIKTIASPERSARQLEIFIPNDNSSTGVQPLKITRAIVEAIQSSDREFSECDIARYLNGYYPEVHASLKPRTIATTLYKIMTKKKIIRQVRRGVHGRPSTFVRLDLEPTEGQEQKDISPSTNSR